MTYTKIDRKSWQISINHQCYVTGLTITSEYQTVTSVNGRTNRHDCQGLLIADQTVNFLPQGLEKFFPNIKSIWITNSKLKKITKNDLKPFKALMDLWLSNNDIVELDGDLFEFNRKLNAFSMEGNSKLKHVGEGIFNDFNLHQVYFGNCGCVNIYSAIDDDISRVIQGLKLQCPSSREMKLKASGFVNDFKELEDKIDSLIKEKVNLQEQVATLTSQFKGCTDEKHNLETIEQGQAATLTSQYEGCLVEKYISVGKKQEKIDELIEGLKMCEDEKIGCLNLMDAQSNQSSSGMICI